MDFDIQSAFLEGKLFRMNRSASENKRETRTESILQGGIEFAVCVLAVLVCASFSAKGLASSPDAAKLSSRPNILLVLVDDMGVMDTSVPFLLDEIGRAHV